VRRLSLFVGSSAMTWGTEIRVSWAGPNLFVYRNWGHLMAVSDGRLSVLDTRIRVLQGNPLGVPVSQTTTIVS